MRVLRLSCELPRRLRIWQRPMRSPALLTDEAVERQSLRENQNQDHTDEQLGLLSVGPAGWSGARSRVRGPARKQLNQGAGRAEPTTRGFPPNRALINERGVFTCIQSILKACGLPSQNSSQGAATRTLATRSARTSRPRHRRCRWPCRRRGPQGRKTGRTTGGRSRRTACTWRARLQAGGEGRRSARGGQRT